MGKCLDGRQLNNFIDVMHERQEVFKRRKLGMEDNSFKDRNFIAVRFL